MARLIAFAGLPGVGKSTVAREVARRTGAVWLRVDSIEQAIRDSGVVPGELNDAGYRAAQAAAEDNLRLGRDVVADCVNDWTTAREGWQRAGERAGADVVWVEVICSDPVEHRRRVETRVVNVPGLTPPDWAAVVAREYHPWDRPRIVVDTSGRNEQAAVEAALGGLGEAT
jgi:predicted kinase